MKAGNLFEQQVRSLARAKWSLPPGAGGARLISGQEIDIVCETEDVTHLIMCTIERKTQKVKSDVEKLGKAARFLQSQGILARQWEITREEPTADQREIARSASVTLHSIAEFRRSLINIDEYFDLRSKYRFGSAADPVSESQVLPEDEYLPLPIRNIRNEEYDSIRSLAQKLENGTIGVLTGDFGAGKSLSTRELFFELRRRFHAAGKQLIPISINLREHWGQSDIAEVLTRHAHNIGYAKPNDLVRAWNAGNCVLLLDGFDELGVQPIVSHPRTRKMARHAATKIIREFVAAARGRTGVLVTGRAYYFDSLEEMRSALGFALVDPILELGVFSEDVASEYLMKRGVSSGLPDWLPRTPLLLGYLVARHLLGAVAELGGIEDPADAWDQFLDRISARDSSLGPDVDAFTVRRLLERLATKSRLAFGGTRELDDTDIGDAFREVTGVSAFDATHILLQRLPGLTSRTSHEGTRQFVDNEMLEVLRASDARYFLVNPYSRFVEGTLQHPLSKFACDALAYYSMQSGVTPQQYVSAAREAVNRWGDGTLALDCLISGGIGAAPSELNCENLTVTDGYADVLDLEEIAFQNLRIQDSAISVLRLGPSENAGVTISNSLIGVVEGATDATGIPPWITAVDVDSFEQGGTTSALLSLDAPLPVRVALTMLKKLYLQRGSGRRDGALRRGLDQQSRQYVDSILDVLRKNRFVSAASRSGNTVWHGNPDMRQRVMKIVAAPLSSGDPIIGELVQLEH
jgi:hypothetical protein